MKRTLVLLAAGLTAAALITGCGGKADQKAQAQESISAEEKKEEGTEAEDTQAEKAETEKEADAAPAFDMKKESELIVAASAGGGSDICGRMIADVVQKNNLSPKNLVVVNKPGGACAVGYNYVGGKKGDDYTLLTLHSGNVLVSYVNNWDLKSDELADIVAIMAYDDLTLCVNADGPYQDLESLVKAAKENPNTLKFGGSNKGNSDQLGYELLKKYADVEMNYVTYDSSGDAATALLGGHVDVAILNPSECIGQVEAKKFKPIVTYAEERLGGLFADAPTFKELGYDKVVVREYRGLSAAKGISEEAMAFYIDMAKKITETKDWQEGYLEKYYLTPVFMGGKEAQDFAKKDVEEAMAVFKEIGYTGE
ncbi:tripartite tricarboxylate transporter substrate binding protein [Clostridium sp. AM58-1XD]|uniref:tripartite tricarboxylate transporter substrate binding protein n=1 Tax=Clostridium sp. AM58-1XD TaxID=2292307 RepID=UPI0015F76CB3|nr:tripartite tricarboxylate transporter substrate binding protein [Clostridium sp. AM58-1XD]